MLARKQLELLKETVPTLARVAAILDAARVTDFEGEAHEAAAKGLGIELLPIGVDGPGGLEPFFEAAVRWGANGVYIVPAPLNSAHQARIAELATQNRLPAIAQHHDAVSLGQLMQYGPSRAVLHRRAATYVDKILRGAKPSDIPAEQPTVFDLAVNLRTAAALGLAVPPSIMILATEVIE